MTEPNRSTVARPLADEHAPYYAKYIELVTEDALVALLEQASSTPALLERAGLDASLQLFHLGRDPGEARDVAADFPAVVKRLEQLLATARTESNVWPVEKK